MDFNSAGQVVALFDATVSVAGAFGDELILFDGGKFRTIVARDDLAAAAFAPDVERKIVGIGPPSLNNEGEVVFVCTVDLGDHVARDLCLYSDLGLWRVSANGGSAAINDRGDIAVGWRAGAGDGLGVGLLVRGLASEEDQPPAPPPVLAADRTIEDDPFAYGSIVITADRNVDAVDINAAGVVAFRSGRGSPFGSVFVAVPPDWPIPDPCEADDPDVCPAYVALGDSYASGEGVPPFEDGTDTSTNMCHRSTRAYSALVTGDVDFPIPAVNRACSGAVVGDLFTARANQAGEQAQLRHLSHQTETITISIGGNDLGFAPIIKDCVLSLVSCALRHDAQVTAATARIGTALSDAYNRMLSAAPDALPLVLGYPRFFPNEPPILLASLVGDNCVAAGNVAGFGISGHEQRWINSKVRAFNDVIRRVVAETAADNGRLVFVDVQEAFDGHELCSLAESYVNGITLTNQEYSFHPNAAGHVALAGRLRAGADAGVGLLVSPGDSLSVPIAVPPGTDLLQVGSDWSGSDVAMSLTAPSGRTIDRTSSSPDVRHHLAETTEIYTVQDPEPGAWLVGLLGASVPPSGERVVLRTSTLRAPNREPVAVARIDATEHPDAASFVFDASASFDPDGQVVDYLWEFGDGTLGSGAMIAHQYPGPGIYTPVLLVVDDDGGMSAPFDFGQLRVAADSPGLAADGVGLVDPLHARWHLHTTGGQSSSFTYGNPRDVPFAGDWDCDGIDTPGVLRPGTNTIYLRNSNTSGVAHASFTAGNPGDVPLAGDFDGDGCDTVALYRPSNQHFYIYNWIGQLGQGLGAAETSFRFGDPGDQPVVGDWDGDGDDTVGVYRASGWLSWSLLVAPGPADGALYFGNPGDRLTMGDWGIVDRRDSPAVFRPTDTTFYFRNSLTPGPAHTTLTFGESDWVVVAGSFGRD